MSRIEKSDAKNKYYLELEGITKIFPGVKALDNVRLKIREGEVHALMGENGAGKSTLMKIINGEYTAESGTIRIDGKPVKIDNPAAALRMGIAMIHQELSPFNEMTVAENLFVGREILSGMVLNKKKMNEETQKLLDRFKVNASPQQKVKELNIGQVQMLEIIKAQSHNARMIIMDEPTSSLSDQEVELLFETIDRLKREGVAIIYISHRMEEIFKMVDRVTVFRDGQYIATKDIDEVDTDSLVTMMVGRKVDSVFPKEEAQITDVALRVENLTIDGVFEDVSFEVRKGEVLGFSGLIGAGRSEVMKAIFGMDKLDGGSIFVEGKQVVIRKPSDAIDLGISFLSEDRKQLGLVLCRSVKENMALPTLGKFHPGVALNKAKEKEICREMSGKLAVKTPSLDTIVNNLSGGNQQKVVLAKWLLTQPKILILDEPTRGIDVGAKSEIHKIMNDLTKIGMAVILISSELPEVMAMSDRIIVMGQGRIRGTFQRSEIVNGVVKQEEILNCALGG